MIFLPEPQFYQQNTGNKAEIFLIFFWILMSLFSLIVCLVTFNTNTTINNEDRKDSWRRKTFCNF